jgi:hypothetical protein
MLRASTLAARARRAQMLRRLGQAMALAAVLSSVTIAHAQSGWVMVPGAGVGRVTLGMKGPELLAVLGAPKAYCWLSANADEQQDVTVLYYSERGLALTLSAPRGTVPTVTRIHVVAGYSATLSDEAGTGVNGKAYRKCAPHGTLTLDVTPGSYITSNGIRPGSSERDVAVKFGPPKAEYRAVVSGDRLTAPADVESLLLHRLLLLPYRARILAYDGIVFGVYDDAVVAITIDWTGFDPHRYVAAHPSQDPRLRDAEVPSIGAAGGPGGQAPR